MKKLIFLVALAIGLASCGTLSMKNITKQLPPLDESAEVFVYEMGDTVPERSEILGGFFLSQESDWETVLEIAKKEARAAGGNGLEIQLQANRFPSKSRHKSYLLSAFILNVNDTIEPTPPTAFDQKDFQDYVIMENGDTIPCSIVFESKSYLQYVVGYERHGNRKAMLLPKRDLLTYHIEDPIAFDKMQQKRKPFNGQIGIDGGYSVPEHFSLSANARFVFKKAVSSSYGIHYNYSSTYNSHILAGSLGVIGSFQKQKTRDQILDFHLDGAVESPVYDKRHRIYGDLLIGFYYSKPDLDYWTHTYQGWITNNSTHYHIKDAAGIAFGVNGGYDFMITEHWGIGLAVYEFVGIPFFGTVDGEVEYFSPRLYRHSLVSLELNAGLRYYF